MAAGDEDGGVFMIDVDDLSWFFFFFQAEDGIRDYKVTGVQTCALPIYHEIDHRERRRWPGRSFVDERGLLVQALQRQADTGNRFVREPAPHLVGALIGQIGRASCRERV